jgi:hypothetical protein
MKDRKELNWDNRGYNLSYTNIHKHFSSILDEQTEILRDRDDVRILCDCIKRFIHLESVLLSFDGSKEFSPLWFTGRTYMSWENSFPLHFEAILQSMSTAQTEGVYIKTFQIDGFYAHLSPMDQRLLAIAESALFKVTTLKLVDSVSLLRFFRWINLENVRNLHVKNCYFVGTDLKEFVCKYSDTLRRLVLQETPVYEHSLELFPTSLDVILN